MKFKSLLVLFCCGAVFQLSKAYDDELIVAVGDHLEIINGTSTFTIRVPSHNSTSQFVALAHDPSTRRLFFSDKDHHEAYVFSIELNLLSLDPPQSLQPILKKDSNQSIESLAYNFVDGTLLWTDGSQQSISRIGADKQTGYQERNVTQLVHSLQGDKLRGLVVDPCTSMMYWSNWNRKRPAIWRSYVNGSDTEVLIEDDLNMPHGIALDFKQQQLYWVDNVRHGVFEIERSYVDGSERQVVYSGKRQFVYGLTVADEYIYWTDWDQHTLWSLPKEHSTTDKPFALRTFPQKPMAVILLQQQPLNCDIVSSVVHHTQNPFIHQQIEEKITPYLTNEICQGFCLNGGECFQSEAEVELRCRCPDSFTGDRCENETILALGMTNTNDIIAALSKSKETMFVALISLTVFCTSLLVAVIGLGIRVRQLSKRPRLKRRFFGPAKSTAPATGPVIDIENCCNMNICETPCTEPPSRTPQSEKKARSADRQKLLNCEF